MSRQANVVASARAVSGVGGASVAAATPGAVSYSRRSDASAAVGVTAGGRQPATRGAFVREWAYWQRPSSR